MKKLNEYFPNTFLAGMLAIVAIVGLVLYGNGGVEGASVNEVQVSNWADSCTESDTNNDPYVPGKVHYGFVEYVDWCTGDGRLGGQYKCVNDNVRSLGGMECPNGCLNGACIR